MGQPIKCSNCRRPFNEKFARCPFCNADASSASAPADPFEKRPPRKCVGCQKPYNATFAKCPFCGTDATATATATATAAKPAGASPGPNFAEMAEQMIQRNRPLLALEFHPAAVTAMDAFFDVTWGTEGTFQTNPTWTPNEAQNFVILHFGVFYGEIFRREFGGRWEVEPNEMLKARVLYADRFVAPIVKVFKRLLLGSKESFEKEYLAERLHLGIRGNPREADGWLRQAQHFASVNRPDLVGVFCARGLALDPSGYTQMELARLGKEAYEKMREES